MPLFERKTPQNGSMSFKVGSHVRPWSSAEFSEYTGYDRDTKGKANHFVQYEIPEALLTGFRRHDIHADPGDVIAFHKDLVHTSNPNESSRYSFALVARAWCPEADLTLSGDIAVQPYKDAHGYPDLRVDPPKPIDTLNERGNM